MKRNPPAVHLHDQGTVTACRCAAHCAPTAHVHRAHPAQPDRLSPAPNRPCIAQGMVVGVQHPVMRLSGVLPTMASRLQATCPAGCVHVSSRVRELVGGWAAPCC